jgi:hypothetical protein
MALFGNFLAMRNAMKNGMHTHKVSKDDEGKIKNKINKIKIYNKR